jgi:hypothetical protein
LKQPSEEREELWRRSCKDNLGPKGTLQRGAESAQPTSRQPKTPSTGATKEKLRRREADRIQREEGKAKAKAERVGREATVHRGAPAARRARTPRPTWSSCSKSVRSPATLSRTNSAVTEAYVNCRCNQKFVKCQSEPEARAMTPSSRTSKASATQS